MELKNNDEILQMGCSQSKTIEKNRIRTYVDLYQQIYNLSLLTTQPFFLGILNKAI